MSNQTHDKIRIGITICDINGIGMEVIIKTFCDPRMIEICTPIVYGSSKIASYHRKMLEQHDFSFNKIKIIKEASSKKPNLIECWEEDVNMSLGESTKEGGKYALASIVAATNDLEKGLIDAIVTAPINKDNIQSDEFNFPGHTEYFANKFKGDSIMLMVNENIKIGVATNHIPISSVANKLSADVIFSKLKILNRSLIQDFCIVGPKIAVLGLNPHAGDTGLIGKEEETIIIPAINNAKSVGVNAFGPYAADGFFGSGNYKKFDAILAMYHDQGLIPFKALSFGDGINFTAGLSVIRTSPDHGVAYEIAGKNKASENSFRQAIYAACDIFKNRTLSKNLNKNPLVAKK